MIVFVFRKRNCPGKIIWRRGEERRRKVHENRQVGHRFQIGEVGFQNQRFHQQAKRHRFENKKITRQQHNVVLKHIL